MASDSASSSQARKGVEPEDDDVQMLRESVDITGDEGEKERDESGLETPRDKGTRTPTGYTPELKRGKFAEGEEREFQQSVQVTEGQAEEGHGRQPRTPEPELYSAIPVAPPPGISQQPVGMQEGSIHQLLQGLVGQMKTGFDNVGERMQELRTDLNRDLGKIRKDQRETKDIATKALTTADSTHKEMQSLAKRVSALEKGGVPAKTATGGGTGTSTEIPGYKSLGGENGTDMVVGEFDQYASREERKTNWAKIKAALPQWMAAEIEKKPQV